MLYTDHKRVEWWLAVVCVFLSCSPRKDLYTERKSYAVTRCSWQLGVRHYLNDSVFEQRTIFLLSGDEFSERRDTYKIIDREWFKLQCGEYTRYLNASDFERSYTPAVYSPDCWKLAVYKPLGPEILHGKTTYRYRYVDLQHSNYFDPILNFDPDIGIVRTTNPDAPEDCRVNDLQVRKKAYLKRKYRNLKINW